MSSHWFATNDLPADVWLRDARVPAALLGAPAPHAPPDPDGLVRLDVRITDGLVVAIAPAGTATAGIDMDGGQLWPCLVDAHVHLDKTEIWQRATNPDGTHPGAVGAVTADRLAHWSEADIAARFEFGLACAHAHGTAAMRTHIDSYGPHARNGWSAFARLRDAWSGRIALQASSLCPTNRLDGDDGVALADLVAEHGGLFGMSTTSTPVDDDFRARLRRFFDLAHARGLRVDLHVDESGEQAARSLKEVAIEAIRRNWGQTIQCGHCCALAVQTDEEAAETIALVRDAGIAIVVLPMCNMYLQGRAPGRTPRWRGVTLIQEFAAAGVPVSFASDNCRDPFYPYGDYDMLEVFRESVRIAQLDHPISPWPASAAATPAQVCGLPGGQVAVGQPADLIGFRARGMSELLARPQTDRVVLRRGRVLDATVPDYRELDRL